MLFTTFNNFQWLWRQLKVCSYNSRFLFCWVVWSSFPIQAVTGFSLTPHFHFYCIPQLYNVHISQLYFSTVFLNCISQWYIVLSCIYQLYFSDVFLNCVHSNLSRACSNTSFALLLPILCEGQLSEQMFKSQVLAFCEYWKPAGEPYNLQVFVIWFHINSVFNGCWFLAHAQIRLLCYLRPACVYLVISSPPRSK